MDAAQHGRGEELRPERVADEVKPRPAAGQRVPEGPEVLAPEALAHRAGAPLHHPEAQHWLPTSRRNYVDALDAGEKSSEPVAEAAEAARRASVPERHGTNWAPFPHVSKDPELEMWKKVGSPGWTRTSDILINSESRERSQPYPEDLRPREPES